MSHIIHIICIHILINLIRGIILSHGQVIHGVNQVGLENKFRHRLTLQSKTVTRNAYGEEVITWTNEKTVWGSIEPLSGREYFQAQQVQSKVTHKVSIRYYTGLRTDWRILFGSRIFDIVSALNIEERNREMVLYCTEFVT